MQIDMSRGQVATMSIVAVGSMITGAFGLWNAWLTNIAFSDHASLSALTESVSDVKNSIDNKVLPSLYAQGNYQVKQIITGTSSTAYEQ